MRQGRAAKRPQIAQTGPKPPLGAALRLARSPHYPLPNPVGAPDPTQELNMTRNLLSALLAAGLLTTGCTENGKGKAEPVEPAPQVHAVAPVAAPAPVAMNDDAGPRDAAPVAEENEPEGSVLMLSHEDPDDEVDHLARAEAMVKTDRDGAINELRQAIFDDPSDEEALRNLAKLAMEAKQVELGEAAWAQLAQVDEDDPEPLEKLARVQLGQKDFAAAVQSATQALTRDTGDAEAYHLRGRAYLAQQKLREAIDSFKAATQLDPGHAYAFNNLGYAYLLTGEYTLAEQALTNAATLAPDVAMIQNNLGLAEEKLGKVDEAKAAYTRATMLKPGYALAHVNLGRLANVAAADTASDVTLVNPDDGELLNAVDGGVGEQAK